LNLEESAVMKKSLQVFLGLFGLTAIFIALLHIVLGPSAIPGSVPVNATMDSEDRFYATMFAAYGVALLWCNKCRSGRVLNDYLVTADVLLELYTAARDRTFPTLKN
jgi:hypothetical protein